MSYKLLKPNRVDFMWHKLQEKPFACDDFKISKELFVEWMLADCNLSYEIGDGAGLASLLCALPDSNAYIQLAVFDYSYENKEQMFRDILVDAFHRRNINRVTAMVTEDRSNARNLVKYLQFSYEGVLRKAFVRKSVYYDVELYALFRDDLFDATYGPKEVYL